MKPIQRLLIASSCCLWLWNCNSASEKKASTVDTVQTEVKKVDSIALKSAGTYYGYLPCADCPGITTYLLLNPDMTYRLEETYKGKNDTAIKHTGSWHRDNNKIILNDGDKVRMSYELDGDRLLQLDIEGRRITGNLGDKYVLTKGGSLANNPAWKEKKEAGIDFIGLGNEPFWSLEIDKGFKVAFNTPEMKTPATTTYTEPQNNNGILTYHIQTEATKLDITILPQFCSDGMSDFLYEYQVKVTYNGRKFNGCGVMLNSL
ncbi:MAG TPA: copper resistance protein NlpE N-terminal domain-containing protein [Chitinophagaceae bacterium]|nr:copper resistance protein NlpE N-terminal domain-containing protein [Chitinophagaceae bacterium]